MAENILLTFLSGVSAPNGEIKTTKFDNVEGEGVHITNESAVRYLQQNDVEISKIFVLASDLIRSEIKDYQPKTTHLEYFKNRMKNFINSEDFITDETIYNYHEENTGEENLQSVAEIAKLIQDYSKGKEIFLHADLTGGMRHINMMMLDIIRLLEYSGIKIDKLIYANLTTKKVEEVKNIYDLFQLISGVEEFINLGSVNALQKYYDKTSAEFEISDKLKNLITAMKNFADAIKLCRYGNFTGAIKNLHDTINNFETTPENVQDILMARLIGKIREKYEMLIATQGEDDLKILRWCIENGYLQQALTLYTERVPEHIFKNFVTLSNKHSEIVKKNLEQDNRNIGFYILNNYLEEDADFKSNRTIFSNEVNSLNKKYFLALKKFIQRKNLSYENLQENFFDGQILKRGVKFPDAEIFKAFEEINKNPKILSENPEASELLPIKKIVDDIKTQLNNFKLYSKAIFNFLNSAKLQEYFPAYEYDTRIFRLEYMLNKKIFRLKMDTEEFFSVMEKYFILKDERNHSNHARLDETGKFETAKQLQSYMQRGLEEIECIKEIEIAEIEEPEEVEEIEEVEKVFVNHTNHSAPNWSAEQKLAAEKYGKIVDVQFPEVPPNLDNGQVKQMVSKFLKEILEHKPTTVLCQGEFNYTFAMVDELKKRSITVVAATSERVIEETVQEDGTTRKISTFKFVNFRKY